MNSKLLETFGEITQLMWKHGWNEANGGNITVRLKNEELEPFRPVLLKSDLATHTALYFDATEIAGEYFLCKGTGKCFRNIQRNPEANLALIHISDDGRSYAQVWGTALPTSEIPAHLLSHTVRKRLSGGVERVIMHCHLTNMIALSFVIPATDASFSNHLWRMMPECAVLFPEGVGLVPYITPGTVEIGDATAAKMQDYRVVMWAQHGTFVSHTDLEDGFNLLESVEKGAELVLKVLAAGVKKIDCITPENARLLGQRFGVELNPRLLGM